MENIRLTQPLVSAGVRVNIRLLLPVKTPGDAPGHGKAVGPAHCKSFGPFTEVINEQRDDRVASLRLRERA